MDNKKLEDKILKEIFPTKDVEKLEINQGNLFGPNSFNPLNTPNIHFNPSFPNNPNIPRPRFEQISPFPLPNIQNNNKIPLFFGNQYRA